MADFEKKIIFFQHKRGCTMESQARKKFILVPARTTSVQTKQLKFQTNRFDRKKVMTRANRKNSVLRETRLNRGVRPIAAAGRPSARNYESLSKTRYNSVRISNFGLNFLQYILNILSFRIKQIKTFRFFQPKLPDYLKMSLIIFLKPMYRNGNSNIT